MLEARDPRSVVDAAEHAAAAGDYVSAEQLLREAALLQEARLGPLHPDLANTLNNLGVVCDITDKPADAELCYRRAYAIATAVLEPDHPFVATSRKNLRDFCEARGKPVELPPPPIVAAPREPPATSFGHLPRERASRPVASHPVSRRFALVRSSRPFVIGALGASGLVLVMFMASRTWFGPKPPASPPSTPESLPAEPIPVPQKTTTTGASAPAPPTVTEARLCKDLSTGGSLGAWRCDRPGLPIKPGSLFFYTRVKSAGDTTVQHRWYRGDRLRKVAQLRIRANLTGGYRTYSRNTVDNGSGGDWRVELRTRDGILLHQERFVVR